MYGRRIIIFFGVDSVIFTVIKLLVNSEYLYVYNIFDIFILMFLIKYIIFKNSSGQIWNNIKIIQMSPGLEFKFKIRFRSSPLVVYLKK